MMNGLKDMINIEDENEGIHELILLIKEEEQKLDKLAGQECQCSSKCLKECVPLEGKAQDIAEYLKELRFQLEYKERNRK